MYLSLALPGKSSPPHNHKNWAVLVGLVGAEEKPALRGWTRAAAFASATRSWSARAWAWH